MEHSPFQRIPPELRNMIWELALHQKSPPTFDNQARAMNIEAHALALTATCRAIRTECLQVFFASNSFIIQGPGMPNVRDLRDRIGCRNFEAVASLTGIILVNRATCFQYFIEQPYRQRFSMSFGLKLWLRKFAVKARKTPGCPPLFMRIKVKRGREPVTAGGHEFWEECTVDLSVQRFHSLYCTDPIGGHMSKYEGDIDCLLQLCEEAFARGAKWSIKKQLVSNLMGGRSCVLTAYPVSSSRELQVL